MSIRSGWRAVMGAFVVIASMGLASSDAQAAEADDQALGMSTASDDDGFAALDVSAGDDLLALGQRYAPPAPRGYRGYRPYRPYWHYRIVPPPIFAPGWFGLYFLGQAPPPRSSAPPPQQPPPQEVRRPDFRHVNEYSLGVSAGVYDGVYASDGREYKDPGLRFNLSYRHTPVVGWELSAGFYGSNMRLDGQGTDARSDVPIQLSAVVHAFPRSPIQPYFVFGGTGNVRTYAFRDSSGNFGDPYTEVRVGPHLGLGLEILFGDRVSMVLDGRSILYTLVDRSVVDQTGQNDFTGTLGLNFYF